MLRRLQGVEPFFSNPNHQENVLLSIKFTDTKYVKKAINNFRKIFSGFHLKIIGDHYYKNENPQNQVYQIPNWIQDCKKANEWAFDNCTLPLNEGLATIAANDSIIVINSSHNLSDGGFMVSALNNCLNDMLYEKENKNPPILSSDLFNDEINEIDKKVDPNVFCPINKLTSCAYDTKDVHLAPPGTKYIDFDGVVPFNQLCCYDNKTLKYFTEIQSIAIATSILALNKVNNNIDFNYNEPLSLAAVLDMRKFIPEYNEFNRSYGNFVVKSTIKADVSKNDTIECICKKFRNSIKILQPYGSFYTVKHVTDFIKTPPKSIFGCISSIGKIKFKRPIVDIDVEDCWKSKIGIGDHGEKFGSQFTIVSYSKSSEYRNEFCYFTRFPPSSMTFENGKILVKSFNHFITKFPFSMKFDDSLNELINFQINVKRNI